MPGFRHAVATIIGNPVLGNPVLGSLILGSLILAGSGVAASLVLPHAAPSATKCSRSAAAPSS